MNFDINLATRVYVDFRKVNYVLILVAFILISWLSLSLYSIAINLELNNKFSEYKIKQISGSKGTKVSENEYAKFLAEVKSVNTILYNRSYDWLALLDNLEQLVPEGVALTGLDPSGKAGFLKLSASARNFSSLRKFIENLEGSKTFTEVFLTDLTHMKAPNKQNGINFNVTCRVANL